MRIKRAFVNARYKTEVLPLLLAGFYTPEASTELLRGISLARIGQSST